MKKSSFRRPESFATKTRGLLSLVLFGGVVLLFLFRLFLPDTFAKVTAPLFRLGTSGTNAVGVIGKSVGELSKEVAHLTRQNEALIAKNEALEAKLQDIGGVVRQGDEIIAGVLARPPVTLYDTLLIEGGVEDGMVVGAPVFSPGGTPIGTIASADERTSRVALYSSGGRESFGWLGEERLAVVLTGSSAGAYEISVPKETVVVIGDMVYLPGPGALPIGTIARISEHPSSPDKKLLVHSLVNIFSLTFVVVFKGALP